MNNAKDDLPSLEGLFIGTKFFLNHLLYKVCPINFSFKKKPPSYNKIVGQALPDIFADKF